ncbi:MAG: phospholipase D family protein [Pseudomonadota bacterium]|jgi:putative cardiolipin synthase|nr:phospholipase D family protein [Rubrivivax sp.]MCA3258555.1 phospholipase D family protein [Rubrivivax sp.]MCE2913656.1 phospholipase D family protein [Rubrivivax sp.]MCZ8031495.1 phospholipase D family protein [Rubrivivax sp.]
MRSALLAATLALAACAQAPPAPLLPPSYAVQGTGGTALGRLAAQQLGTAAAGISAVHPLPLGLESLAARLALAERAERTLDLQYYIWRPDASGEVLAAALWRAAERGVRVRLLLDDWGARPSEDDLGLLAAHPNIEVRLFNPLGLRGAPLLAMLFDFERANRRMHNKAMMADNEAAIVGGRNIGDEYFERRPELEFGDFELLAFGPVVRGLSAGFDAYWNSAGLHRVAPSARSTPSTSPPAQARARDAAATGVAGGLDRGTLRFYLGPAQALQDPPGKIDPQAQTPDSAVLGQLIAQAVGGVERELLLVSPYFVPGAGGVEQFRALRERGVRVRIITNSLSATDVMAVHAGYARYRRALIEAGVELFEIRADGPRQRRGGRIGASSGSSRLSLHAKVIVADRRSAFVGSMNVDPRSVRLNTENGVVVHSAELASDIAAGVDGALAESAWRVVLHEGALRWVARDGEREVVADEEPQTGWWLRLRVRLLSWLPIEGLL